MRKAIVLLVLLGLGLACKKHVCDCPLPYQIYYLKAVVVETSNLDCLKPVLDFTEDSARIHMLTGLNKERFVMTDLPFEFRVLGKKLYVSVRNLKTEEEFACATMGPPLTHLKLLDAKPRE